MGRKTRVQASKVPFSECMWKLNFPVCKIKHAAPWSQAACAIREMVQDLILISVFI